MMQSLFSLENVTASAHDAFAQMLSSPPLPPELVRLHVYAYRKDSITKTSTCISDGNSISRKQPVNYLLAGRAFTSTGGAKGVCLSMAGGLADAGVNAGVHMHNICKTQAGAPPLTMPHYVALTGPRHRTGMG